jgi:hypothetical protein
MKKVEEKEMLQDGGGRRLGRQSGMSLASMFTEKID